MLKIYVAGPINSIDCLEYLRNIRRGIRMATKLFKDGFAPYCPHLDYHFMLQAEEGNDFEIEDYYAYSMAWLEASDAVLLLTNWQASTGAMAEVDRAYELGIPVFGHYEALVAWDKDPTSMADGKRP